jgi:hypothetical protein
VFFSAPLSLLPGCVPAAAARRLFGTSIQKHPSKSKKAVKVYSQRANFLSSTKAKQRKLCRRSQRTKRPGRADSAQVVAVADEYHLDGWSPPTSKRRCCKFCRGLSPPITVLSERKESTTTAHFPMGSKRFSHVLFCRSEHRNIFAFADQSIYLSRWVPHSLLILGARFKRRLKTSSDDTMYFFA